MTLFLEILFWLSAAAMAHSYVWYPGWLRVKCGNKKLVPPPTFADGEAPEVIVLMAVYNEEKVIRQKMDSLLRLDYPKQRLSFYIGSDNSSDQTNDIITGYAKKDPRIHFFPFTNRNGKPGQINRLVTEITATRPLTDDLLFLMTDASVMLDPDTLKNLVRHTRDPHIALVDSNMQNTGLAADGISKSENQYVSGEVMIKQRESILWQRMIGPFGGCYLLRSNYFSPVPPRFLVDDFYIALKVFENGGGAINDLEAFSYESVSHEIGEEYRRKVRIGAGNFQNLLTFKHLLWPIHRPLAFAFLSHKVLRWFGPFFIIFALASSAILAALGNQFYLGLLVIQIVLWVGLPLLDYGLRIIGIHLSLLRHIRYFIVMNIALLHGFINYLNGIKSSIWQPTKRT